MAKTWIKPDFVAKAWIKHIVVTKTIIKHEVVAKASIFIAFGYEKNNPAQRAGGKNNLASILSEKKFPAQTYFPAPLPEYQMDRALNRFMLKRLPIEIEISLFLNRYISI